MTDQKPTFDGHRIPYNFSLSHQDLRCGNYIQKAGIPVMVELWVLQEIRGGRHQYGPMSLTMEILNYNKWRVPKWDNMWSYAHAGGIYGIVFESDIPTLYFGGRHGVAVPCVHKLQNLIYELSGEELKLKL